MQFTARFANNYASPQQQNLFQELENDNGLFSKLIELDEKESAQSMIVRDLIKAMFEKINIKRENLIHDAFNEPTKLTFTYRILFTESLKTLPLHIKTIEQLIILWKEWENDGFYSAEIKTWNELSNEQRQVACQIWNTIGEKTRETIRFEQLIDKTKQRKEQLIKIIESIRLCMNSYCQGASDQIVYQKLLEDIETQLEEKKVLSISIPEKIEEIQPFAERLNSVFSSHVWQNYHQSNIKFEDIFLSYFCLYL